MTKEKGEGVAVIAHGITLKSVTLPFIGDPALARSGPESREFAR